MLSLSTSWSYPRHDDGRALAREARAAGFEWIEISHGTKISQLPGLLAAVEAREIKVSSLHNFCPAPVEVMIDAPDVYEFTSHRAVERERAISLTRKTIEMAERFRTSRIVLHLGSVPMKPITQRLEMMARAGELYSRDYCEWKLKLVAQREKVSAVYLQRAKDALEQLLPLCEAKQVQLGIETRSHYEQMPNEREMLILLEYFKDSPWIGAWHDFGHVQRQANLALTDHEQYLRSIASRLIGCHVHDVKWPMKDHRVPLTEAGVAFAQLLPWVPRGIPLVWELSPSQTSADIQDALPRWRTLEAGSGASLI